MSTGAAGRVLGDAGGTRAMTAVMAIMLFLTVLAAALGLATATARASLDRQLAGRMTVQVVDGDPEARDRIAARLLARLRASPDVVRARAVDPAAIARLLGPWLGAEAEAGLPIPALIDLDLATRDTAAAARVAALVRSGGPAARVDAQAAWMSPVGGFMRSLVWLSALLVALMAGATAAVVVLAARAGLDQHRATIEVMHMLGSTDRQVARLFQRRIATDAALGGGAGALAAAMVVWLVGGQLGALGSELVGAARLSAGDWVVLALLPAAFVGLAIVAARRAVVGALERQL